MALQKITRDGVEFVVSPKGTFRIWKKAELSDEECMAFLYVIAEVSKDPHSEHVFQEGCRLARQGTEAEPGVSTADLKQALAQGMKGLLEKKLIGVEKDGMGGYAPKCYYASRIVWIDNSIPKLVLMDE
jgi:hypothetical protein